MIFTLLAATPLIAQEERAVASRDTGNATTETTATEDTPPTVSLARSIDIQHIRPQDQRGINIFETPKEPGAAFRGFRLDFGAAFAQQFQSLSHSNTATPKPTTSGTTTFNANELMDIGNGFNNATANLYLNAQLAPGIRVALATYLSSRHHNETWVKDGYILIDASPVKVKALEDMMKYVTLRIGHFEINYGDAHFRRSDNGNAIYNPFVGNLIMDAFTTQIGGEVYVRSRGFMAMAGVTGGEIRGNVTRPEERSPAYIAKLGYDRQVTNDLRVRLTGSTYQQKKAINNTLYAGDRAGSRYYWVLENTQATESANFSSGLINPNLRSKVQAYMINPFAKYRGFEVFGTIEQARGRAATETETREWNQYAVDVVQRFLPREQLFVGGRYNTAEGELAGMPGKPSVDRVQLSAGWFITPSVLMKGEWVKQDYNGFPTTDIRNGGKFDGFMLEAVVAF
ncbi:MAG TPA: hypothetical protein VJ672_11460 [Gemmatimonadaceae bacterium]|nr:hypothetical protein [Gemmatimonadaceae bacterium]